MRRLRGPLGFLAGPLAWALSFGLLFLAYRASVATSWPSPAVGFVAAFSVVCAVVVASSLAAAQRGVGKRRDFVWTLAGAAVAWAAWLEVVPTPLAALFGGAGLLVASAAAGSGLGRTVDDPRYLWPLVLVASSVDMYSVLSAQGPTAQLVAGEGVVPAFYLFLAPPIPSVGLDGVLGAGDLVFSGFLAGMAARHALSMRRVGLGLLAGFALCMVALVVVQVPLPALPFLGAVTAASLGASVRPRPRELLLAAGFSAAVVLLGHIALG